MFASGDSGASCEGKTAFQPEFDIFRRIVTRLTFASFPTSSPYVTSVGATQLVDFDKAEDVRSFAFHPFADRNQAASFSGGGFSNVFSQPSYQSASVANFIATSKNLPPAKYYNATSRAYPDVSAAGVVCFNH